MKILINYANARFEQARKINSWTGRHIAKFDKIYEFGPSDIDPDFRTQHSQIFSYERGNGLWLWKSYFLHKVIKESQDGDYIFYIDSGAFFIRNPQVLLDYITDESPIFVTDIPLVECNWTKPECFDIMNAHAFKYTNQIQSGIIIFKVNKKSRDFFEEYFKLSKDTDMLISEGLSKKQLPDYDYGEKFVSHREDQSILSLLCKINGIEAHRDITQRWKNEMSFFNPHYLFKPVSHPKDNYPTILFLHKSGKISTYILKRIYTILKLYKLKKIFRR